ncbi:hypothetical protein DPMN_127633 [Dreissena polymorpha]|uniref:Uncharacterized protein n=1 Tax=Dreissena polymorpha TaxID=45954 RepID=A0A9D4H5L7_DREPO|nr:hypothetical protein DPMN_127633 [Dreissena polymorpha]
MKKYGYKCDLRLIKWYFVLSLVPDEVTTDSLSCSNGKCDNEWGYISLALIGFGAVLFIFIGYEIYARKKKLQQSDIYFKLQKQARRSKLKQIKEKQKTIKRQKKEELKQSKKKEDNALLSERNESHIEDIECQTLEGECSIVAGVAEKNLTSRDPIGTKGPFAEHSGSSGVTESPPEPAPCTCEDDLQLVPRGDGHREWRFSDDCNYLLEAIV